MGKSWFIHLIGVQYANFDGKQRAIMQISNLLGATFTISWAVAHAIDIWSVSSSKFECAEKQAERCLPACCWICVHGTLQCIYIHLLTKLATLESFSKSIHHGLPLLLLKLAVDQTWLDSYTLLLYKNVACRTANSNTNRHFEHVDAVYRMLYMSTLQSYYKPHF